MEEFFERIKQAVKLFNSLKKEKPIRIISHHDADGITSASILVKALKRKDIKFSLSIVKQVDEDLIEQLNREVCETVFFTDLGSSSLKLLSENLKKENVIILDHHIIDKVKMDFMQVNPHEFKIDGGKEVSGAGVVYFFVKELDAVNVDSAYLALIGAIGDVQENKGFSGLNKLILDDAINSGKLEIRRGLRMFGMQTKPIHKVLEYSTDPYIPGVTGNEEGARKFLEEIGIDFRENGRYKKLIHLNDDDMKKLVTSIILTRLGSEENPDDVLGPIYLLKDEEDESPTRDAKEFSTLLNAVGRMHKSGLGIGTCLGCLELKEDAINLLQSYKREIIDSLNWFYKNKESSSVIEEKGYIIINAGDNIKESLIGTLASIISKSNLYRNGTVIVAMAYTLDGSIKISSRLMNVKGKNSINLNKVMKKVVENFGGVGGGHDVAAGASIPQEKEKEFIAFMQKQLEGVYVEEKIK